MEADRRSILHYRVGSWNNSIGDTDRGQNSYLVKLASCHQQARAAVLRPRCSLFSLRTPNLAVTLSLSLSLRLRERTRVIWGKRGGIPFLESFSNATLRTRASPVPADQPPRSSLPARSSLWQSKMRRMMCMPCCYNDPELQIDPDTVYPVRPECRDDIPKTRFKPRPGLTLSPKRWKLLHNEEGCLDIAGMLKRVQRGGVHPNIKGEVWEFLLGCYDPKSTTEQRNQLRQQRRLEYEKLKTRCREMDTTVGSGRVITMPVITEDGQPIEEPNSDGGPRPSSVGSEEETNGVPLPKEVIQWKLTLHQIGLDVNRTDRALVYYESQENLARLWDILAVYSWVDKDIGYCQGMSDLCSPISILLEHEADAFWCFERLMRRVRGNFKSTSTSIGVRSQLTTLATIMKTVDPKLHEHLENLDGGEYLFAFRMLMVLFRREFSFVDTMYLWELMWSMEYNPSLFSMLESNTGTSGTNTKDENVIKKCGKFERKKLQVTKRDEIPLSVFIVASVLEARNKRLLSEAKGLDDVVKILNDITGSLDAKKACRGALQIHEKYLNTVKAS